jgi:hypothetical protein
MTFEWGMIGVQLRLALRRPGFRGLLFANVVAGAAGAMARTGLHGLSPGAGALGGTMGGFTAAVTAWPVLAAVAAAVFLCDRSARLVAESMLVCGLPLRRLSGAQIGAAVLASVVAIGVALPAGAIVGLGDALRQQGAYVGSGTVVPPFAAAVVGAGYLVVLFAALAVAVRTPPRLFGVLIVSILVFFAALPIGRDYRYLRLLLAATPWGPLWATVYDQPARYELSLPMSTVHRAVVLAVWLAVSGVVLWFGTRPDRGR